MKFNPTLNLEINGEKFSYRLFDALLHISETWSQREAAKRLGISHAVLNRRIRDAEDKLGFKLVYTTGSGSGLTPQAISILTKYHQYLKRLQERDKPVICSGNISTSLMDVLAHYYGLETVITSTDDLNVIEMAGMGLADVLVLDDPVHAFLHDLDFIPIARDHMVLISGFEGIPQSMEDLEGKKFVEIQHSAQRLAWNTLDQLKIDYEIVEVCNSPHTALKMVTGSDDLHTFLNHSFTSGIVAGSDLLKEDTAHIISMILWNPNPQLESFLEFILGKGQKIVEKCGFDRIE
ncbi:MAG: LysR family transcriptional regulator [Methanobacterium sp.]|nr:LysR family transcriptional regulator [Methanobacterium sp.]